MTANHTIAATFTPVTSSYTLTVTKSGTGTGTVTTSPAGTSFTAGTVVTLTAAADASSTFTGWSGCMFRNSYHLSGDDELQIRASAQPSLLNRPIRYHRFCRSWWNNLPVGQRKRGQCGQARPLRLPRNQGTRVRYVLIDGSNYGALTSYTFTNVKANHTIKAYFIRSR